MQVPVPAVIASLPVSGPLVRIEHASESPVAAKLSVPPLEPPEADIDKWSKLVRETGIELE